MADWEGLHAEILASILEKVSFIEDFVAFGYVCKSWREAVINNKQYLRPQIPLLMMTGNNEGHQKIFRLSKKDILKRNLYIPEMSGKFCIGLNYGWVLTTSWGEEMHLVHPLSRNRIELPDRKSLDTCEYYTTYPSTSSAALSANPSESSDFVLMIVPASGLYLGYWRFGDKQWRLIKKQGLETWFSDVTHYGDRFYALAYNGKVWDCSVLNTQGPALVVDLKPYHGYPLAYIVESKGNLLAIARCTKIKNSKEEDEDTDTSTKYASWTYKFQVYKLDLINRGYEKVKSLGGEAIFVGQNTSISLDVSELGGGLFKSDHIYFTDDSVGRLAWRGSRGSGKDIGSYSLEDDRITPIKVDTSLISPVDPPFWFIPSL